jgi:hypothetical protein
MKRTDIRAFYALPQVRRRIREYLGGGNGKEPTCIYLAQPDLGRFHLSTAISPGQLPALLDEDSDISRSLWDRKSLIAHLDIEYVNFDFPGEAYLDPERAFRLQRPVCAAAERLFQEYGIEPLHIASGRGHHYVWRIQRRSAAFKRLHRIGRCNDTLLGRYRCPRLSIDGPVPVEFGLAFAGLGMVMEYLAGQIKAEATATCALPVELTAVAVGPGERGREMISIDVSEYGDPLYLRVIRMPFTAYLKASAMDPNYAFTASSNADTLITVIVDDIPIEQALSAMRDAGEAAVLAKKTNARIPDSSSGTARLISAYETSPLFSFHNRFYAEDQHPPEQWPSTYDRTQMDLLPACAAHILSSPNDLLMQPAAIEMVVRALLSLGWHPRHIAGLIRSRYERDYGWGNQWLVHDAATRADFYTRIFAGLFATGIDDLVDFNCCSIREKGLCLRPQNDCGIMEMRNSLLERRRHDRLDNRPLDRLFLQDEHL